MKESEMIDVPNCSKCSLLEEKEEELKKARQEARWFQDELDKKIVSEQKLMQMLAAKDRIIVKMVAEIYGEV